MLPPIVSVSHGRKEYPWLWQVIRSVFSLQLWGAVLYATMLMNPATAQEPDRFGDQHLESGSGPMRRPEGRMPSPLNTDSQISLNIDPATYVREWRDSTGNYRIRATLNEERTDGVVLTKEVDGSSIIVPFDRLSLKDQMYLCVVHEDKEFGRARINSLGAQVAEKDFMGPGGPVWRRWVMLILPVIGIICGITILVHAFQAHIVWGLAVLFIPCLYVIFALLNWNRSGKYLVCQLLCFAAAAYLSTLELPNTVHAFGEIYEFIKETQQLQKPQA